MEQRTILKKALETLGFENQSPTNQIYELTLKDSLPAIGITWVGNKISFYPLTPLFYEVYKYDRTNISQSDFAPIATFDLNIFRTPEETIETIKRTCADMVSQLCYEDMTKVQKANENTKEFSEIVEGTREDALQYIRKIYELHKNKEGRLDCCNIEGTPMTIIVCGKVETLFEIRNGLANDLCLDGISVYSLSTPELLILCEKLKNSFTYE